jgi:hypothetical protein
MVTHLTELEGPYDPLRLLAFDPRDLVRFALTASDYWADKALDWIASGVPSSSMRQELTSLEEDRRRPQSLRHRARGARKLLDHC